MSTVGQHLHAHLDVIVDGEPVPVPANLGISAASGQMSELHTHDPNGVIHVETSNATARYTLGQLFNEWDVRLDQASVGGLSAGEGKTLSAYVNGEKVEGNPAAIALQDQAQIALVFGAPATNPSPPANYDFGAM